MKRALALAAVLALAACPPSAPPLPPEDGGTGGGAGGGGGGSGGGDAGQDAGPPADLCGVGIAGCSTGSSCLLTELDDGGRGRRCLPGSCDLVTQDCDGGQKCDYRDGGRTCVTDGTLAEGAICAGNGDACLKGTVCATVPIPDGGYEARCTKYCGVSADCTAPQQCLLTLVVPASLERPQVCANPPPTCDLLTQTCTASTDGCYPNGAQASCFGAGSVATAGACVYSNDCQRGATCVNTSGGASCRVMCSYPTGTPDCADAGICLRLSGTTGVGVCI